jgi:hypothetical protein
MRSHMSCSVSVQRRQLQNRSSSIPEHAKGALRGPERFVEIAAASNGLNACPRRKKADGLVRTPTRFARAEARPASRAALARPRVWLV